MKMMESGITFNDRHSFKDFGITVQSRSFGNPAKKKVTEDVAYSNTVYDYSNLYGGTEYGERQITYVFNIVSYSKAGYLALKDAVINWLFSTTTKQILRDDTIIGQYFLAEMVNAPTSNDNNFDGTLSVTFTAYPFKISDYEEGSDIWDTFNFLIDYAQETEFIVSSFSTVNLQNPGITGVYPTIKSTAEMKITKDGITYVVPIGSTTSYDFILNPGENKFTISGKGTISFHFKKELI